MLSVKLQNRQSTKASYAVKNLRAMPSVGAPYTNRAAHIAGSHRTIDRGTSDKTNHRWMSIIFKFINIYIDLDLIYCTANFHITAINNSISYELIHYAPCE